MKQLERIRPIIIKKFKDHPKFYKTYYVKKKLRISFSDLVMAITPVGWDVFFVEVLHKNSPSEFKLAYAKLCKNKEELLDMLETTRKDYKKPKKITKVKHKHIGFRVDITEKLIEAFSSHPKYIQVYEGYKKLFVVFEDILILIEPMGGTFYSWELFKREGEVEVSHKDAGSKIGFDRIVDVVVQQRERCDREIGTM